jgi:multiple sugar transport system permease protein
MYKRSREGLFFLLPGVIWILTFTFFPLFASLALSLSDARLQTINSGWHFIGLQNFADIFTDRRVGGVVLTTVFLSLGSLLLTMILGTLFAWLFNQKVAGLRFLRSMMTMPLFAAPIALGYMGMIMFNETSGAINTILRSLGGPGVSWFTDPWSARFSILIADTWQWTPFVSIVLLAAMQAIPEELYEAASLDSSPSWMTFRMITLPLIAPAMGTVALLRLVETLKILDVPLSMTGGGPGAATQTYSYYTYITGLKNFDLGYASSLAYMLVVLCVVISTIYFARVRERFE